MRCQLLTVCLQLTDTAGDSGGFCVVPGSHKSNFPIPPSLADFSPEFQEHVVQPAPQAGDVMIFTESVLHGTLPWTSDWQRRTVVYRFAPAGSAYGRGYLPEWPVAAREGMTEAQLAVMEAPYHPRMDRPYLSNDGECSTGRPREQFKIDFDKQVFGARYF